MALLYHWQRDNYETDIAGYSPGDDLLLAQNSATFAAAQPGERLWAFTRRGDDTYVLAAQLRIKEIRAAGPGNEYGRFQAVPVPGSTVLYDTDRATDAEPILRDLSIRADADILGRSFQGPGAVRHLSEADDRRLAEFAEDMPALSRQRPTVSPDAVAEAWPAVAEAARRSQAQREIFGSPTRNARYSVEAVEERRLRITRLDANEPAILTRGRVERGLSAVIAAGGRVRRRSLFGTVAEETALVFFHPDLDWDQTGDWIRYTALTSTPPPLRLYEEYNRAAVHAIFAPGTPFTPGAGAWGLHRIVRIPGRPGDYVFFVTFGQTQGEHVFEESVTEDGVLTWQSQPSQTLSDPVIRDLIRHDETVHAIYLFLRTRKGSPYTYLGRLKYLTHDRDREQPVHFQWQILPQPVPPEVAERIGLALEPTADEAIPALPPSGILEERPPPVAAHRRGESTPTFRARRRGDPAERDAKNRELGLVGERLVLRHEQESLAEAGRLDLAERVRHVSVQEGDGAGFDIESFTPAGATKHIEVKTTRGPAETPLYVSANEMAFARLHADSFYLYRVFDYDSEADSGHFYVIRGDPAVVFDCRPTEYRLSPRAVSEGV
jgi:hypothetical protein